MFGSGARPIPTARSAQPLTSTGTLPETYTSLPHALLDPAEAAERGWTSCPSGLWLIENSRPLDKAELDNAREIAARHGFRIETRDDRSNLRMIRLAAGLTGMLLALGVLAATLGLIRGESANDVRTLDSGRRAAVDAARDRRGHRRYAGGASARLLGIASAYIGLVAGRRRPSDAAAVGATWRSSPSALRCWRRSSPGCSPAGSRRRSPAVRSTDRAIDPERVTPPD